MLDDEDEDVAAERSRVSSGAAGADILQVNQLTKIYQHLNRKIYAVKRLSVGIPAGEVSLPARRPTFGRGGLLELLSPKSLCGEALGSKLKSDNDKIRVYTGGKYFGR